MRVKIKSMEELRCLSTYSNEDKEFLFFKEGNILKKTCEKEYEVKEFDYNKKAFKNMKTKSWTHESTEGQALFFRKEWFDVIKEKPIYVEVKRCSEITFWYLPIIGLNLVFEVTEDKENAEDWKVKNQLGGYFIKKKDCDVVTEEELCLYR